MSGCRAPGTVSAGHFGGGRRRDTKGTRTPGRVRVPRWPPPSAGTVSTRNAGAGAVTPRTPTSGWREPGTPGPAGAVTPRTPKRQEGRRQERWAPGTRNAKDGVCPGVTADLVHLWQMLGSATLASSESGTIQRHWDPPERLGLGLYLFLKTNLVYIFDWTCVFSLTLLTLILTKNLGVCFYESPWLTNLGGIVGFLTKTSFQSF